MIVADLSGRSQSQTRLVCRVEAEMASSGFCDTGLVGQSDEWAGHYSILIWRSRDREVLLRDDTSCWIETSER